MMKKLLPLIIGLVGLAAGAGAGLALRPGGGEKADDGDRAADTAHGEEAGAEAGHGEDGDEAHAEDAAHAEDSGHGEDADHAEDSGVPDYVKLNNQFVIPVVEGGRVAAMVILSLSLEVKVGTSEAVYAREPKLRDALLQVLFDHANAGGFRGAFTDGANLVILRRALKETAQKIMGDTVSDVLISDIVRQDS